MRAPTGFNGDGVLDLAVTGLIELDAMLNLIPSGNTMVKVLLGNGDGTFQPALSYVVGADPAMVAVGDFNADGFPDVAVTVTDGVSVLLNAADWGR